MGWDLWRQCCAAGSGTRTGAGAARDNDNRTLSGEYKGGGGGSNAKYKDSTDNIIRCAVFDHCTLTQLPHDILIHERTLTRLSAEANRITDLPPQLFFCKELTDIQLSDNDIRALPSAISNLKELVLLDCSKNSIVSLPDEIKSLKKLRILDLSANPLEKLPEPVTSLISLHELYLNDVGLEYLPANFGRLTDLRILELRDNRLALLPKSLARAALLGRLDLGRNEFADLPEVVGEFSQLKELWIDGNSFVDLPPAVGKLTSLVHLEAEDNFLSLLPDEIGKCRSLECLSLMGNRLSRLPNTIGSLTRLVTLDLQANSLSSLPDEIGEMSDLEELLLSKNFLTKLPPTVGRLRKLRCFLVDENNLKYLPAEIGSCTALGVLSLRSNRIEQIPEEIGRLTKLKVLNLVSNTLQNLPHTLLNCGELVALWLAENQSKPLVPMQAEIDPHTKRRVLTCILFPQLPPVDYRGKDEAPSSTQASPRHISFVDVKAAAKAQDKPGQLRRAPTPYPKELRAMAKHAKNANVNRDSADEPLLSAPAEVRVKAAKITPTLRQRFADDLGLGENGWTDIDNGGALSSPSPDRSFSENPYEDGSARGSDRQLYSESNDSAYGGYIEKVDDHIEASPTVSRPNDLSFDRDSPSASSALYHPSFVNGEYGHSSNSRYVNRDKLKSPMNRNVDYVETYAQAKEKIYGNHRSNYQQRHYNHSNGQMPNVTMNCNSVVLSPDDLNYVNCNIEKNYDESDVSCELKFTPKSQHDHPDGVYGNSNLTDSSNVSNLSPPPYHIAATFSKQAQFFNQNNLRESFNN